MEFQKMDMQLCTILMEQIDCERIKALADSIGTPFYLMFPDRYCYNLDTFVSSFKKYYPKVIAGYSFKTNYVPALCNKAKLIGCFAEVVSEFELELAIRLGFQRIIFNGPIKNKNALEKAIKYKAIINLDAEYEVDYVCKYKQMHPNAYLQVGIRLNVNLTDKEGCSKIQCGLRHGRFGFPREILAKNLGLLSSCGIKICSIHGHTSSSDRAVMNYRVISDYMLSVCEKFQLNDVEYFNIGGGFFGAPPKGLDLTGKPSYQDYADTILNCVLANKWFVNHKPYIVIEPGSSVVSNVFEYYTQIYQLKTIGNKNFVIVDGSVFDVKPTMHTNNLPFSLIQNKESRSDGISVYDVVGSTCMEKDIILSGVSLPDTIGKGDFIQIRGVGAYTLSLTPTFINFLPPVISIEGNGNTRLVRRRQNIEDILAIYRL